MNQAEVLKHVDHTVLKVDATWADVATLCDQAIKYNTASVCIPASFVKQAKEYVQDKMVVCTVIGFPNGYNCTESKVCETKVAIAEGATEIDMVINVGWLKDKKYDAILEEIKAIKAACGDLILKVIIETCLLTDDETIKMCEIVSASGADFIKTSTGFSTAGATAHDIALMHQYVAPHVKIKAAGGIASFADAEEFMGLGALRLGTSRLVKIAENETADGVY